MPHEVLAASPLTQRLTAMGVSQDQLDQVRFCGNNRHVPFEMWSFTFIPGAPHEAMSLTKAYCSLRWLLADPPWSRDRDDAWHYVSDTINAPVLAQGLRFKEAQRNRAQKPRCRLGDGLTMTDVIQDLAVSREYRDLTARELWPHLHAKLDELALSPKEIPDGSAYSYEFGHGRKSISRRHFANVVSRCRTAKKSR
jgi:hypothetical protein